MSVTLNKGGNVSLSKVAPNLRQIAVGLGWDARATSGADFDLDASALMVGANGKILSDSHFVFFNNLRSLDGSERVHPNREPGGRRGDRPLRRPSGPPTRHSRAATAARSCARARVLLPG